MKPKWMVAGLSSVLALSFLAPTVNADRLSDLEQKQREAQQQQSQLNSGITEKTKEINKNATKLEKLAAKIEELNNKINETEAKIDEVQAQIDQTKAEIDELRKSIDELERKIAEREELLKERARAIQLSGGSVDYIDVLLGANNFVDFIDRFSAVNTLIEADREIMREQAEDKKLLAEQKAQVETKLAEQEARHAELMGLKASLDGQKKEQADLVKELEAEQKRLAEEKAHLEDEHHETIKISAKLEKQIADEQARLAEIARKAEKAHQRELAAKKAAARKFQAVSSVSSSNRAPASGGMFIQPAAGRYSSGYGGRDIGAGAENHLGQDIANVTGTPIWASASGYVSFAGAMGGYGNVVIMTHFINGQSYATVYAHMSAIKVSVGQAVSQGQTVGLVGSTGRSTGPHLHFEIHVGSWNGARSNAVNPMNYLQ
ncbi:murein hydrolase activator EnvC [Planomicrobium sp. CPCC 101110]|uniref:murein hydrolase activator EnvC family protein n=1 Tax=Planomicrobium sp. CPCC 101110 TaxID=2599619 RepID=UPI0011B42F2D|nr:peptidoglycan DD-metalloendopeptidase family protein [Planomicrobium sp. CPCC 101110]TWT27292.1 peptidoglycan DD-metalloendopeptidase family protein [Planomicrobium sp. CPCC 101110]